MLKKKTIFFCLLFLVQSYAYAQRTEVGLAIGGMSYSGDLSRGYKILNQNIGIQGIYRINFDRDISFRTTLLFGKISGSDNDPIDALAEVRSASFSRMLMELSGSLEYHFLDYKGKNSIVRWSPYFFVGFGFTKILRVDAEVGDFSSFQPVIPFGVGVKHLLGKQFSAGVEFGIRKTFFDELDEISEGDVYDKANTQYGNPYDKDWYHFFNISISYTFYTVSCNYRYVPNGGFRK